MNYGHLVDMADLVIEKIGLKDDEGGSLRSSIVNSLREYWEDYATHVWGIDDVYAVSLDEGYPMSDQVARDILGLLEDDVDCDYGITWESVRITIADTLIDYSEEWEKMTPEEMEKFSGLFVIAWRSKVRKLPRFKVLLEKKVEEIYIGEEHVRILSVSLKSAYDEMVRIANKYGAASLLSIDIDQVRSIQIRRPSGPLTDLLHVMMSYERNKEN